MRLKDHVSKLVGHLAEHHRVMAECHGAACDDPGQSDAARQFHKMMAAHHAGMTDCMKGVHEACSKAQDDVDLAKIVGDVTDATVRAELIRKGFSQPAAGAPRLVARAGEALPHDEALSAEAQEIFDPGATR
jgi:hypothetical protein